MSVTDSLSVRDHAEFLSRQYQNKCTDVICSISQVCLTDQHLAVLMDVALGGNLTSYVSDQYKHAERHGLFLTEVTRTYGRTSLPVHDRIHEH